jgi:ketosteroid isomerase-like protein
MIVLPLALLVTALVGASVMAQTAQEIEARNKAIVAASFEAWRAGTGSPYDLLADDAVWTIVGNSLASKTYGSREAFMSEVIGPFVARMSLGLKPTIRDIYADGDTVIVFFDAEGTARDGRPYANTYAWFLSPSTTSGSASPRRSEGRSRFPSASRPRAPSRTQFALPATVRQSTVLCDNQTPPYSNHLPVLQGRLRWRSGSRRR